MPQISDLTSENIPVVKLDENRSIVRVIGGDYIGVQGAAGDPQPAQPADIRLVPGSQTSIPVPSGWNAASPPGGWRGHHSGFTVVRGRRYGGVRGTRTPGHHPDRTAPSRFILMMGEP